MIIRGKIVVVFDIEVFPNAFFCTVKETESQKVGVIEISNRRNDLDKLVNLFQVLSKPISWGQNYNTTQQIPGKYIYCGYNNLHYDTPIINYIIANYAELSTLPRFEICDRINRLSQEIVNSKEEGFASWHKWKYMVYFESLDLLTMLFSQKLRVGLKEMQVTMQYSNVQEYDGDFNSYLPDSEIPEVLAYNLNDVESTEELLNRCKDKIDLRIAIENEYGVKVLNKDGVNIGMKIITQKYLERTGLTWSQIKDLRSPCDLINLKEIILPFIKFENPILQNVLNELKQQVVSPGRKGYEKHFLLDNLEYSVGVGGIHSVNDPSKFIPKEGWIISDIDVASLYPSLIIEYGFYPPHLGKEFLEIYSNIKKERIEAKHNGNNVKNETLKLALNGLSGNLQNENNFCYSPRTVMQIRMNGQLLLLMLAERLIKLGYEILQINTDGIFILRDLNRDSEFKQVCNDWENLTHLTLEEDQFEAFYQFDVNDYLAVKRGYSQTKNPKLLKKKGLFIDSVSLGKGMRPIIIPEAINKYLADGVPVEDTILNCKDINKFITYQKVSRAYSVEYNNELITHINRYYISKKGYHLYKCKVDSNGKRSNYINMLKGHGVIICNDLTKFAEFPDNIDYNYYISESKKIVKRFMYKTLSLF